MIDVPMIEKAQQISADLFERGIAQDSLVQEQGRLARAIPVLNDARQIVSWFIGITVADRLAGFIQLNSALEFMRYASLQRTPGSLDGCPLARTWLDPEHILELSKSRFDPESQLDTPFLSFDGHVSRLAWKVTAQEKDGQRKVIFVAGNYVYSADE